MDIIELRKFAIQIAQTTTKDGVELMYRANKILKFLERGIIDESKEDQNEWLCVIVIPTDKEKSEGNV